MIDAETLIKKFQLQPHPEGGLFKETYRATGAIQKTHLPDVYGGNRNYSTAIYYLLLPDTKSQFHKLKSDEIWHFYLGGSLTLVQIFEDGKIEKMVLGPNIEANEKVQHVIQANCWFCAYPNPEAPYTVLWDARWHLVLTFKTLNWETMNNCLRHTLRPNASLIIQQISVTKVHALYINPKVEG